MRALFSCLLLASALLGCGGSSGGTGGAGSSSATEPAVDLGGSWSGDVVSSTGARATFTAELTENGSVVGGSVRALGACIGGGRIDGTIDGDVLDAKVTAGDAVATLRLTVSDRDQLDGTYVMPAVGACVGDTGSVSMTRAR